MKRDPRLHGLSSDHHHALRLAWDVAEAAKTHALDANLVERVRATFDAELAPHFAVEEEVLLPALTATGTATAAALVERTLRDHRWLQAELEAAEGGDASRLLAFAERLKAHVRFEEHELFPTCEHELADEVLDEAARRAPKRP
ncbi:MAG: hemerythrin domain-containing protein [Vicinamibacteraceae bacterium]|nr:hemerythrin domain-containing protein [Vicinamibacteraceae bacterium]